MNFPRPFIFIDIEATGADPSRDRVVEIALVKMTPDKVQTEYIQRVNPGVRIPLEVIDVHHITNEDVSKCPSFKQIAKDVAAFMEGCDIAGFGICRFDIPILKEEFRRAEVHFDIDNRSIIDGLTIYHQKERRDLTAAYEFYCHKTLVGAHGALPDARASMEVIFAQLERYTDLPQSVEGLHNFCNRQDDRYVDSTRKMMWRDGEAMFNFGKHKGELLKDLVKKQRDYIEWIVSDGKFQQDVVDICWRALRGEFPQNDKRNNDKPASNGHQNPGLGKSA